MVGIARKITLWSKEEISSLFKTARVCSKKQNFEVRKRKQSGPIGRVLIIIPKKAGNAATRNRLRRQIKAFFYEEKCHLDGYDFIIFIRAVVKSNQLEMLKKIIRTCLEK